MLFKIKAKNNAGETIEGVREAPDRLTLAREARAEGLNLYLAENLTKKQSVAKGWSLFKSVGLKDKILFAGNLSSMISAGLPLARALEVLERQTTHAYFKTVLQEILRAVNTGGSLSTALASFPKVFPSVFVAMVAAGEESGKLPESLKIIRDQMNKTYDLRRKITGAMIYPAIIMLAIVVIAILMMAFMVPQLSATFKDLNVQLPLSTRLVIGTSDFIASHLWLCFTTLFALVAAGYGWTKTKMGQGINDQVVFHLPVFGLLVKEYNTAVVMRTISSLLASGVSMTKSLDITSKVLQNTLYVPILTAAPAQIEQGLLLSAVLSKQPKLFPPLALELTEVGEETGDLPKMLAEGAAFYESEIDQATKNLSTIIEPLLMVVIGIAVGFFVVSMIGPMYSLSSAIN